MLYQLPNGKVIYMSVEEFLSLSDQELHDLAHSGYGEEPSYNSSFAKSSTKKGKDTEKKSDPNYIEKASDLDYTPESDETDTKGPVDYNNLDD